MNNRPTATPEQVADVDTALRLLVRVRNHLKSADCPKALARVRLAISSVKGARRNVRSRRYE